MNKKKFKKEYIKQNILLKDDEIFKEEKIFDNYGKFLE